MGYDLASIPIFRMSRTDLRRQRELQEFVKQNRLISFNLAAGDWLIQCPYNNGHFILEEKFVRHQINCRVQYEKKCRRENRKPEISICQWNSHHHIPNSELAEHEASCPNMAETVDRLAYFSRIGQEKERKERELKAQAETKFADEKMPVFQDENENWTSDEAAAANVKPDAWGFDEKPKNDEKHHVKSEYEEKPDLKPEYEEKPDMKPEYEEKLDMKPEYEEKLDMKPEYEEKPDMKPEYEEKPEYEDMEESDEENWDKELERNPGETYDPRARLREGRGRMIQDAPGITTKSERKKFRAAQAELFENQYKGDTAVLDNLRGDPMEHQNFGVPELSEQQRRTQELQQVQQAKKNAQLSANYHSLADRNRRTVFAADQLNAIMAQAAAEAEHLPSNDLTMSTSTLNDDTDATSNATGSTMSLI